MVLVSCIEDLKRLVLILIYFNLVSLFILQTMEMGKFSWGFELPM